MSDRKLGVRIKAQELDENLSVKLLRSHETGECLYINDHRIVGGKPDYRGKNRIWERKTTLRNIVRAIPELQRALNLNAFGKPND